jgi:hypothetical protein
MGMHGPGVAFTAHHQQVTRAESFGYLSMGTTAEGIHLDGGGVLAPIAGIGIGNLLADPQMLLQGVN